MRRPKPQRSPPVDARVPVRLAASPRLRVFRAKNAKLAEIGAIRRALHRTKGVAAHPMSWCVPGLPGDRVGYPSGGRLWRAELCTASSRHDEVDVERELSQVWIPRWTSGPRGGSGVTQSARRSTRARMRLRFEPHRRAGLDRGFDRRSGCRSGLNVAGGATVGGARSIFLNTEERSRNGGKGGRRGVGRKEGSGDGVGGSVGRGGERRRWSTR
jgi:hypothetical protein